MCDLVRDVEAIHGLCKLLTASGKLQFPGHHSYFRKDLQVILTVKEGGIQLPHPELGHI